MDPSQCYQELTQAISEGDLAKARGFALALEDWLLKGGFYPPEYCPKEVDACLERVFRPAEKIGRTGQ